MSVLLGKGEEAHQGKVGGGQFRKNLIKNSKNI